MYQSQVVSSGTETSKSSALLLQYSAHICLFCRSNAIDGKLGKIIDRLQDILRAKNITETIRTMCNELHELLLELKGQPMGERENSLDICDEIIEYLKEHKNIDTRLEAIIGKIEAVVRLKYQLLENASAALGEAARLSTDIFHKPSIKDFDIVKPISKGAYGRVFLVRKITTGDLYAMKVIKKSDTLHKNQQQNIIMERNILHNVQNPFVVRLFYTFQSKEYLFWVMEYVPGGDLYSLLRGLTCFEEDMARQYVAEVVLALEYCHSKGIVHRDLKPDNLLINADGHIKLTDFGLSRYGLMELDIYSGFPGEEPDSEDLQVLSPLLNKGSNIKDFAEECLPSLDSVVVDTLNSKVGTPDYLAPEVILGQGHGKAVDWWSLGVILYEFLLGFPPFNASTPAQIFENIVSLNIVWPQDTEDLSNEAADLIARLLVLDPAERLGVPGTFVNSEE